MAFFVLCAIRFTRNLDLVIVRVFLCLIFLLVQGNVGSTQVAVATHRNRIQDFEVAKIGKRFSLNVRYPQLNRNDSFDFGNLKAPTFVSLGFYYCGPCRAAMPHFIQVAKTRQQNNFVYITFDDKSLIEQELRDNKQELDSLPANLSILRMTKDRQYYHALVVGYPVKYFLHSDGIVSAVHRGGAVNHMEKEVASWIEALNALH